MNTEDKVVDLGERIHHLTMLDELDRQKAKAERAKRTAEKREIDTERATLKVRRKGAVYALAEQIADPVKFRNATRSGIFYRSGDKFCVRVDEARELGYEIIEV